MRIDFSGFFGDKSDAGKARAFFEARAEFRELLGRADSVSFDAAIATIADVAVNTEEFGFALSEETKANTLHEAGDEESRCFLFVVHKR